MEKAIRLITVLRLRRSELCGFFSVPPPPIDTRPEWIYDAASITAGGANRVTFASIIFGESDPLFNSFGRIRPRIGEEEGEGRGVNGFPGGARRRPECSSDRMPGAVSPSPSPPACMHSARKYRENSFSTFCQKNCFVFPHKLLMTQANKDPNGFMEFPRPPTIQILIGRPWFRRSEIKNPSLTLSHTYSHTVRPATPSLNF